ncbi:unnamed protein product [Withania somnifera]
MAIELCSDDSSPRISFSNGISQTDTLQVGSANSSSSTSSLDFDFCVCHQSFDDLQSSSADELFFDGKILPVEMKRKIPPTLSPNKIEKPLIKSHKLIIPSNTNFKNEKLSSSSSEEKNSKSFWRFKRSNSLNCGSSYARTLCPLPLLSRSNSTGSTPSVKHKQHYHKSSSSLSNGHYHQKPPLRKIPSNPYSNGIIINSVLNVPPANLFGLSSIFSSGKEKNKKR